MRRKTEDVLWIIAGLIASTVLLPFVLLLDLLHQGRVPLWLLRAITWRKRRKAPGPKDVDQLRLTPREHLILADYAREIR